MITIKSPSNFCVLTILDYTWTEMATDVGAWHVVYYIDTLFLIGI